LVDDKDGISADEKYYVSGRTSRPLIYMGKYWQDLNCGDSLFPIRIRQLIIGTCPDLKGPNCLGTFAAL